MKLTVLIDNYVSTEGPDVRGEAGFSALLEDGGLRVLFDTGYSDLLLFNAGRLGISLDGLTHLVFSHGHLDHTYGFPPLARAHDLAAVRVIAHPRLCDRRFDEDGDIGTPFTRAELEARCRTTFSASPVALSDRLLYLGAIPRENDFEAREPIGQIACGDGFEPDFIPDDSALVYRRNDGLFIITGCSHSGICNILEHAKRVCGDRRIAGVLGGFHLFAPGERLDRTVAYLRAQNIPLFYPCHCVSLAAKIAMGAVLPVREVGAGLTLEL